LEDLNPKSCLSFQVPETEKQGKGGLFGVHVKLLYVDVFVQAFERRHTSQSSQARYEVVLSPKWGHDIVKCYSYLAAL
jgi:hypothetical protein